MMVTGDRVGAERMVDPAKGLTKFSQGTVLRTTRSGIRLVLWDEEGTDHMGRPTRLSFRTLPELRRVR